MAKVLNYTDDANGRTVKGAFDEDGRVHFIFTDDSVMVIGGICDECSCAAYIDAMDEFHVSQLPPAMRVRLGLMSSEEAEARDKMEKDAKTEQRKREDKETLARLIREYPDAAGAMLAQVPPTSQPVTVGEGR